MRNPFPLAWPDGSTRTPPDLRKTSPFHVKRSETGSTDFRRYELPFTSTYNELALELKRLSVVNSVITSDLPLNSKGIPYPNAKAGSDPGIAVWFMLPDANGNVAERVLACDKWKTPADNMYAITLTIAAMRGMDRWGAADVVQRAFSGFTALPPGSGETVNARPMPPKPKPWRDVLGLNAEIYRNLDLDDLVALAKAKHRTLMKDAHPDAGGSDGRAAMLNAAMEDAEREYATKCAEVSR